MERWSFNTLLFSRLPDVLDISIAEIAKRCDIRQQVLNRYVKGENELPVKVLIKMCNALRMPCYFFVSEDNNHEIPNREAATIAADRWVPVEWDCQAVDRTFGSDGGRIYWKDVAAVMGVTPQKPHDRFLLKKRLTVFELVDVCNHFGLSPFTFIVDGNRGGDGKKKGRSPADQGGATPAELLDAIGALRQQVSELSAGYRDIAAKYGSLQADYGNLLDAHKLLLRRFDDHVGEGILGLAADDSQLA